MKQLTNGYNLRLANQEDLPTIIGMCSRFYEFTEYKQQAPMSLSKVYDTITWYLDQKITEAVIILLEKEGAVVGMISAAKAPTPFWLDFVGVEQVWWVDEEHRSINSIAMVLALEEWAKQVGLKGLVMSSLEINNKVNRLYTKLGFKLTETAYYKNLRE